MKTFKGLRDWLADWRWNVENLAAKLWLLAKHRPCITCPVCKGTGGAVSGYYEPEWYECYACWRHFHRLEDRGWTWFVGRLPVWSYVRARASIAAGMEPTRLRNVIRCKVLGWHIWMNEDGFEPGLRVCCACYKDKKVKAPASHVAGSEGEGER